MQYDQYKVSQEKYKAQHANPFPWSALECAPGGGSLFNSATCSSLPARAYLLIPAHRCGWHGSATVPRQYIWLLCVIVVCEQNISQICRVRGRVQVAHLILLGGCNARAGTCRRTRPAATKGERIQGGTATPAACSAQTVLLKPCR